MNWITGIPRLTRFLWQAENRVTWNSCYANHSIEEQKIFKKILIYLLYFMQPKIRVKWNRATRNNVSRGIPVHSTLFMGFWIHKSPNSPVYTFSTLFYAKIMYFYMELLKAINAILLQLTLVYFFPKKHGFFGNFHEILIWKFLFFSIFATFSWKNQ